MISNFRYKSSWEEFEHAVKILKDLCKQQKACLLVETLSELDIYIENEEARKIDEDILRIIYGEILYLLSLRMEKGKLEKERLRKSIASVQKEASDDEIETMMMNVYNKMELIEDAFDAETLERRYYLKQNAVNPKLSDFDYSVYTRHMPGGKQIECAIVSIACKKNLDDIQGRANDSEPEKDITFICDEEDIDFLIYQLEEVKREIRECQNGDSTK